MSASRNKPEEEFLQKQRPVKGVLKGLCRVCIFLKMMSQVEKQNLKGKVIELKKRIFQNYYSCLPRWLCGSLQSLKFRVYRQNERVEQIFQIIN